MGCLQQALLAYGAGINTNCNPTSFSGATGWFDATSASLPGLADGGAVGSTTNWIDQVTGTRNWSQGTSANRPTLHTTGGPNNQPYISWDSTDLLVFSNTASAILSSNAWTFFYVIRPQRNGTTNGDEFGPNPYTNGGYVGLSLFSTGGNNKFRHYRYNSGYIGVNSTTTFSQNVWYIIEAWKDASNIYIKVNNDTEVSTAAGSAGSLADTPTIGNALTSDVAGVYVWNADIGSTNRGTFRTCLGARFGISV